MWLRHWGLNRDPFGPGAPIFVPTASHAEAVARLVHQVENREPRTDLRGELGIGKSAVLNEAIGRLRRPTRRVVAVRHPPDGDALLRGLAGGLGHRLDAGARRSEATGRLLDAVRVADASGLDLVLAIDGDGLLDAPEDCRLLDRIEAIARQAVGRCSVIVVGREEPDHRDPWRLSIRLDRLTRIETGDYLSSKLRAGGQARPLFSDRAILRLHAISRGLPAAIERLAGLSLRAGAIDRTSMITAPIVEAVAAECDERALASPMPS